MSRSLSGLTEGIFSEIDVLDTISIDGNAGTQGQVLTTDGTNCDWQDITIADGSITNAMLTANCVEGDNILSGAIIESKLGPEAVTGAKIKAGAVTNGKIGVAAVDSNQIAGSAIITSKIANGAVQNINLATDAVTTVKIADSQVTTAKINNQAVTNAKIANGAINHLKISTGGVATTNIEDEAMSLVAEQLEQIKKENNAMVNEMAEFRAKVEKDLEEKSAKIIELGTQEIATPVTRVAQKPIWKKY